MNDDADSKDDELWRERGTQVMEGGEARPADSAASMLTALALLVPPLCAIVGV